MNKTEFLKQLAQTPRTWRLSMFGLIECPGAHPSELACPVTAVHNRSHRNLWQRAIMSLKLNVIGYQIVQAADDPLCHNTVLRQELLDACGIDAKMATEAASRLRKSLDSH